MTGARLSELLGLTWERVRVYDLEDAEVEFAFQVDRNARLTATKTDGSARTVPIPPQLARILAAHKQRASRVAATDFVFCTRTGKAFSQRNIGRALRGAQMKAKTRVTRAVYVRELADVRRRSMRPSKMAAEFADVLGPLDTD